MIGRHRYWFLVLLVWVVAVTTWPRDAAAQSLAMAQLNPAVRVNDDTGRNVSGTNDPTIALTITGGDCKSQKLNYEFSLSVTGYDTTQTLQTWVTRSTDCSSEYSTATSVTRSCWRVAPDASVVNGIAKIKIPPSRLLGIQPDGGFEGNQQILKKSCDETPTVGGKGRQNFNVYFLLINNAGTVAAKATQQMYFSLVGPDAPPLTSVSAAENALRLTWNPMSTSTTELTYEFFCAPNLGGKSCQSPLLESLGSTRATSGAGGGTSTSITAGGSTATSAAEGGSSGEGGSTGDEGWWDTAGNAGAGGGTFEDVMQATTSTGVAGGTTTPSAASFACGKVSGKFNGSGFTSTSLDNEQSYAVALGVRDTFGNLGKLSGYTCGTPRPIKTFYEAYREGGGQAGGGFCNLGLQTSRATPFAAGLLLGLAAWLRRRKR